MEKPRNESPGNRLAALDRNIPPLPLCVLRPTNIPTYLLSGQSSFFNPRRSIHRGVSPQSLGDIRLGETIGLGEFLANFGRGSKVDAKSLFGAFTHKEFDNREDDFKKRRLTERKKVERERLCVCACVAGLDCGQLPICFDQITCVNQTYVYQITTSCRYGTYRLTNMKGRKTYGERPLNGRQDDLDHGTVKLCQLDPLWMCQEYNAVFLRGGHFFQGGVNHVPNGPSHGFSGILRLVLIAG